MIYIETKYHLKNMLFLSEIYYEKKKIRKKQMFC